MGQVTYKVVPPVDSVQSVGEHIYNSNLTFGLMVDISN